MRIPETRRFGLGIENLLEFVYKKWIEIIFVLNKHIHDLNSDTNILPSFREAKILLARFRQAQNSLKWWFHGKINCFFIKSILIMVNLWKKQVIQLENDLWHLFMCSSEQNLISFHFFPNTILRDLLTLTPCFQEAALPASPKSVRLGVDILRVVDRVGMWTEWGRRKGWGVRQGEAQGVREVLGLREEHRVREERRVSSKHKVQNTEWVNNRKQIYRMRLKYGGTREKNASTKG